MLNENNLHAYQEHGRDHIINNPAAALFKDMGLGKTVTTLTAFNTLKYKLLDIENCLIIAPKRVVESVWAQEAEKWEHLKHLKIIKVVGTPKQRLTALKTPADIHLIGRDSVAWLCAQYGGLMLPFDMIVIDESSSFKNHQSQRFKALKFAIPSVGRKVLLTGTPAPNGLIDLWAQMYLLDRGARLEKTITAFRKKYFYEAVKNGHIVYKYGLQKGADSSIKDAIKDITISMKAEDYLTLPGRIVNDVVVQFPPKLQKQYNDFERDRVLEMFGDDQEVTATNAAALRIKLLQFANGAIYDEDRNVREVHALKLDAAEEIVESAAGKPVLIAWQFRHDRDRLIERFKRYKPRQIQDKNAVEDWNAGKVQILMMHPASGGHGLNLQKGGNIIVWYGLTDAAELYEQFNARLDRQGQENLVMIHRLLAYNTEDQNVAKGLEDKINVQNNLMASVKAKINKWLKNVKNSV